MQTSWNGRVLVWIGMTCLFAPGFAIAQDGDVEKVRVRTLVGAPTATLGPVGTPLAATGAPRPAIMLTGYWPPSNEAVRRFSADPAQNPQGWIGQDWENRGYDIYSYFPEFSPPTCTSCGTGSGDLEVDYQDTSPDFWNLANALKPIAIITFSRTNASFSWETEMNQYNRSTWVNDYVNPKQPTPVPPDSGVPAGFLRLSSLPVQDIVNAVSAAQLGLNAFICFSGDGGGFLSEFIAYHGVWYRDLHQSPTDPDWCIAAGHIHVGKDITWPVAQAATEVTLRTLIQQLDSVRATTLCQTDLGSGGPGDATLAMCGDVFQSGGTADLGLWGAPPSTLIHFFAGAFPGAASLGAGTFIPSAPLIFFSLPSNAAGQLLFKNVPGGGGPATAYLQAVFADNSLPGKIGLSNALKIDIQP